MPELPEVETIRAGAAPHCVGARVEDIVIRRWRLRWPIPDDLPAHIVGQRIEAVERRAKYLLFRFAKGQIMMHFGMSGTLRIYPVDEAPAVKKHDHIDMLLSNGKLLRYNDPRRFGAILWHEAGQTCALLDTLAPEPLSDAFSIDYLVARARGRSVSIKSLIMDQKHVVGVGNIYANEALFQCGIHPGTLAKDVGRKALVQLHGCIVSVLRAAIESGGTTLKDFASPEGRPGYFAQTLLVYGREGEACQRCAMPIVSIRQNGRASFYCPSCQKGD